MIFYISQTNPETELMRLLLSLVIASFLFSPATAQTKQITITSLNAVPRDQQVLLSWTPGQTGVLSYVIEKSKNGTDFVAFSTVQGSDNALEFFETDFQPYEGLSYYRISVTDANGVTSFSNTVPVKYNSEGEPVSPTAGVTAVSDDGVLVIVRNKSGEEFYSKVQVQSAYDPVLCTSLDPNLSAGTYTIVGCSDQAYYAKQLLVK
jgi:hypothetical protein